RLNSLGLALMQTGRFADAAVAFQHVVELDPKNAPAYESLGVALLQTQRVDDALASFEHLVQLAPNSPAAHATMGQAFLQAGRVREAAASFQRAVDVQPDSAQALASLAWLEATERDAPLNPEHAVRLAVRAAELSGQRDPRILDV